jgi:hypothetical protein
VSTAQPPAKTVFTWLQANLGKGCLQQLTGQDYKALAAAAQLVPLWCNSDDRAAVAQAFRLVVEQMQPGCRELAFHGIAHAADWGHRAQLWHQAGLAPFERIRLYASDPGAPRA